VRHFIHDFAATWATTATEFPPKPWRNWFAILAWPGNIRESQNVIERSVVIHHQGNLSGTVLLLKWSRTSPHISFPGDLQWKIEK
jgi:transcriptional regulator with PAS, ATPase and Fis domain